MYCVKCGVKLSDGVGECPLCGTKVYVPAESDGKREKNYPDELPSHYREKGLASLFVVTLLSVTVIAVVLLVCFRLYGELRWGGFAAGGTALFYVIAVLPFWFRRPKAEIFVPADHAAAALYILYCCVRTGGSWFVSFALPVIALSCILSEAMICLLKYVRRGRLFIFGGFFILFGGFFAAAEFFEHLTFGTEMFRWSLYPLTVFAAAGLFLLTAGMIRPMRNALERRFFF